MFASVDPKRMTGSQIADAEVPHGAAGKRALLMGEEPNDLCGKCSHPPAHVLTQETVKLQQWLLTA